MQQSGTNATNTGEFKLKWPRILGRRSVELDTTRKEGKEMKRSMAFLMGFAVIMAICSGYADAAAPRNGLVGEWLFEGNSDDTSGNGNNGTVHGATLTGDRFWRPKGAYFFNGSNAWIQVKASGSLNLTGALTIAAWVYIKANDSAGYAMILSRGESSDPWEFFCYQNKLGLYLGDPNYFSGTVDVPIGKWVHVAATWDGSKVKFYVNAAKDSTEHDFTGSLGQVAEDLFIGRSPYGDDEHLNGRLDHVRIYNRALTSAEIDDLYHDKEPVISAFTASPDAGSSPLRVDFACRAKSPNGAITNYFWDVDGDGTPNYGNNIPRQSHQYTVNGEYKARVRAVDSSGYWAFSDWVTVRVKDGPELAGKIENYSYDDTTKALTINAKVYNYGNAAAGPFTVVACVSDNGVGSKCFATVKVDSLPAGQHTAIAFNKNFTDSIHGRLISVVIDPAGKVAKDYAGNNGSQAYIGTPSWSVRDLTASQWGLNAYWPFDGDANDKSGNGNHGTVEGAVLCPDRFGAANKAYCFDGVDDDIGIGSKVWVKPEFPLTISAWIKTKDRIQDQAVFQNDSWTSGAYNGLFVRIGYGGVYAGYGDGGIAAPWSRRGVYTVSSPIKTEKWQHVAVRFNAHVDVDIFVDGVKRTVEWEDSSGGSLHYSLDPGYIGTDWSGNYHFNGAIEEVRVYNRALSNDQINALFHDKGLSIGAFYAWPNAGSAPLDVKFVCGAASPSSTITQYLWDFNADNIWDSITSAGTTSHTYDQNGTYKARVRVVDSAGFKVVSDYITVRVKDGGELAGKVEYYNFDDATKTMAVKVRVHNFGNTATPAFNVAFTVSDNGVGRSPIGTVPVSEGLPAGGNKLVTFTKTLSESVIGRTVSVAIDSGKKVSEVYEGNNELQVYVGPNLK